MFANIGYWICVPFAFIVRFFYNLTGSYGLALILFTLVLKLFMLPFQMKSKKSMVRMSRMSDKIQAIRDKYPNNQVKANEEIQKFYADEGVNPMSGCLWSFIPLPILLALYSIIRQPITHLMMVSMEKMEELVAAVAALPGFDISTIAQLKNGAMVIKDGFTELTVYGQIALTKAVNTYLPELGAATEGWIDLNYQFLGLDLTVTPWSQFGDFSFTWSTIGLILIPILAGVSQMIMSKITMKEQADKTAAQSTRMMMFMMPFMSVYFAFIMPAALGVYWIAQSVFSLIQEILMSKFYNSKLEAEENAREEARAADRKRRMEEAKRQQEERAKQQQIKQSLKDKQRAAQDAKAAKAAKAERSTTDAGRVDNRPYARGRAYDPDRYKD